MKIFGLYITTVKKHEADNALTAKLLGENTFLQKSVERLLDAIVKGSRQVRRAAERRLAKTGN